MATWPTPQMCLVQHARERLQPQLHWLTTTQHPGAATTNHETRRPARTPDEKNQKSSLRARYSRLDP